MNFWTNLKLRLLVVGALGCVSYNLLKCVHWVSTWIKTWNIPDHNYAGINSFNCLINPCSKPSSNPLFYQVVWLNLKIFLSLNIGPGNRTQDSVVTCGRTNSYATESVSSIDTASVAKLLVLPQVTTESWVRFPGLISRDQNISRFHHNRYALADNPITSLVCILCGIYLCASPPAIPMRRCPNSLGSNGSPSFSLGNPRCAGQLPSRLR